MSEDSIDDSTVKQSKAPLYISIGVVLIVVLAYFFVPSVHDFLQNAWNVLTSSDEKRINVWVGQFGFWGPLIIVLVMVLQMFLIVIPTPILMLVSIIAFGPIWGSLIALLAIFTASSVGYFIGRYFGPVIVDKLIGHKSQNKIAHFIDDYGFWTVIVIRLNPFLSDDAISFVGGVLRMGYFKFIGATLLGTAPLIVFMAFLEENYQQSNSILIWASIACIVFFGLFIWWDKKWKKRRENRKSK